MGWFCIYASTKSSTYLITGRKNNTETYDIATKEALALDNVLRSLSDTIRNKWVDAYDNQAVVHQHGSGKVAVVLR